MSMDPESNAAATRTGARPAARSRRIHAAASTPAARLMLYRVWTAVGVCVLCIFALNVMGVLAPVIEFLAVGALIAFVEAPIVNFLEHRGVARGAAAFVGLVVVVAAIALVFGTVLPVFTEQVLEILQRLPGQLRGLGDWLTGLSREFSALASSDWADELNDAIASLASSLAGYVTAIAAEMGKGMVPFISGFASQLFVMFLGLVLAYWLALDYPRIHREVGVIVGGEREVGYRFMVAVLSRSVGGYMSGMIVTSVVNGLLAFVGLMVIGHPYAGLMGVLTGLFHLVPVVGPFVSALFATLLAFFVEPLTALWTLVVCVVMQNVTDNVISPKVMQSSVQVHPAMSLTALVVGSALLGPIGMVVAIPLCAALKGLFIFYFEGTTERALVSYDGAIFKGTPFRDAQGRPVPAFDALGDDKFAADSEIIDDDAVPEATAAPKPELDNPWSKIAGLQPGSTGMWRIPFAPDRGPAKAGGGRPGAPYADPRPDARPGGAEAPADRPPARRRPDPPEIS